MKKLIYFAGFALLATTIASTVTSCGPSAEEVARQDSIRRADSIRTQDSIRIADSLQQARKAEEEAQAIRNRVDIEFAQISKDMMPVKVYALNKIVYGSGEPLKKKYVCIKNVATGETKTIMLKNDYCDYTEDDGFLCNIELMKDNKCVSAFVHCGGSGPFGDEYIIDVEKEKIIKHTSDF